MDYLLKHWLAWVWPASVLAITIAVALAVHRILLAISKRVVRRKGSVLLNSLLHHGKKPLGWILPLIALLGVVPAAGFSEKVLTPIQRALGLGLIAAIAWLIILFSEVAADLISARHSVDVADNLEARRIQTQIQVLHRIVVAIVAVVTLAVMLMTFPSIWEIGTSLLASAGLAGLIVGMAMKNSLSSLIAGIQIAFTQPIRLEDVVVVEGEWGRVEEIDTTYVVVRLWDLRRLVLPLSYFLEHPFQNWTRRSADLLGSVILHVDYTVPVEEIRKELRRILESTDDWKGEVCVLQVTDAGPETIQLRALMDARDSSAAWNLRCYVREKLLQFVQQKYPHALPRVRTELERVPAEFMPRNLFGQNPGGGMQNVKQELRSNSASNR
ncbi:MAG: mechanosensitive ion channel family protein [Candidatus Acidiferrales bacterium]